MSQPADGPRAAARRSQAKAFDVPLQLETRESRAPRRRPRPSTATRAHVASAVRTLSGIVPFATLPIAVACSP
jgi:hypothetical protein